MWYHFKNLPFSDPFDDDDDDVDDDAAAGSTDAAKNENRASVW